MVLHDRIELSTSPLPTHSFPARALFSLVVFSGIPATSGTSCRVFGAIDTENARTVFFAAAAQHAI
ncbi:hypothetical protein [Sandarakinorhabdus sp.]|uniref:hypothetical protein n=1 Tax=Sandarakinorhabdus sp. TaxID=1916663 RepID=UPI00356B4D4B